MTAFLEKLKSLTRATDSRRSSPFGSERATQRWLQNLPGSSDYDKHHALVEGLERYNGDTRGDALNRIKVLRLLEDTGLTFQASIVDQYLKNQGASDTARQTLWRECHLFWDQLAVAYLTFLGLALRGGEAKKLSPLSTEIAVRSLRYFSLSMRWEYLRGRRPGETAWRRLHKIYRMAEIAGVLLDEVEIEGINTSCAREYVMTLLFDLANPYAFGPGEVQLVLEILNNILELPVPESGLRHDMHSHMVDLAASSGPERIEDRWVPGSRLRYLDLRGVLLELEQRASQAHDASQSALCRKLARVIGRAGANRSGPRKPRFGEVRAVFGTDAVLKIFAPYRGIVPNTEFIALRDESSKGVGFVLSEEHELPLGRLLAIDREEGQGAWQLLAVRWVAEEENQWLLGTEILSKYPKRVDIEWEDGDLGKDTSVALFLPLASVSKGAVSNLLMPRAAYTSGRELLLRQDDGLGYRLKLGGVIETHDSWLRVGFDVLTREAASTHSA
jgi:hypothetical protein